VLKSYNSKLYKYYNPLGVVIFYMLINLIMG